jgi:hypothetical protein
MGLIKPIRPLEDKPECVTEMVWVDLTIDEQDRILASVAKASAYETLPVLTNAEWFDTIRRKVGRTVLPLAPPGVDLREARYRAHPMTEGEAREAVLSDWLRKWEQVIEAQRQNRARLEEAERQKVCPVCQRPGSKESGQDTCKPCALAESLVIAQGQLAYARPDGKSVGDVLRDKAERGK